MKLVQILSFITLVITYLSADVTVLTSNSSGEISAMFTMPKFSINKLVVDGKDLSTISVNNTYGKLEVKGEPALPFTSFAFKLNRSGDVTIRVDSIRSHNISVLPITPSKGSLTRNINPNNIPLQFNNTYSIDSWYPENSITAGDPYFIRDARGVSVRVTPFSYNGEKKTLKIIDTLYFTIIENGPANRRSTQETPPDFEKVIKSMFINSKNSVSPRYTPLNDGNKMIIITADKYYSAAKKLALWKNRKGISTEIYKYPSETSGSGVSSLTSFIAGKYSSENISYVTLIGDYEDIPSKSRDYNDGSQGAEDDGDVSSDPSYAYISGNDKYPDVFIGRISASSLDEANTIVSKTTNYEMHPEVGGAWYQKSVALGSSEGTPADYQWMRDTIVPLFENIGYSKIDSIYQGVTNNGVSDFSSYINSGRGIVTFMGHGNNDGFGFQSSFWYSTKYIKQLNNGDKLPVVIPLACQYGTIKGRTCAAEVWMRQPNGGAVVTMGSTPLMDWTPPQYAMVEMIRLIKRGTHQSMGAIFYNGEMKMLDKTSRGEKTMNTWQYHGDPSLQFFYKTPDQIKLNISGNAQKGNNTITVSGDNGVLVTLYSKENGFISSKTINNGDVEFSFSLDNDGILYITGTETNRSPALDSQTIAAVQEENVAPTEINISNSTVVEGAPANSFVGILSTVDKNSYDSHTYEVLKGDFIVHKDSLFTSKKLVGENVKVEIKSTDSGQLSTTKQFEIIVTKDPYFELVSECDWYGSNDSLGSTALINYDSIAIAISANLVKVADSNYDSYASLVGEFTGNILDDAQFRITYNSNDSLRLILPMNKLLESGSGHYIPLPSTNGKDSIILFTLKDFKQPEWTEVKDKSNLIISEVHEIVIENGSDDSTESKSNFKINTLGIIGYKLGVTPTKSSQLLNGSTLKIASYSNTSINLSIPTSGEYSIILFTINGRQLFNRKLSLNSGNRLINFDRTISNNFVIAQIIGYGLSYTQKLLLK